MSIESRPTTDHESAHVSVVPPLQPGDRLMRPEFKRRYDAMPSEEHAELIEGVVYMGSPVSAEEHGEPHGKLIYFLGHYSVHSKGIEFGDNSSVNLDLENAPQPDCYLRIKEEHGGQSYLKEGYIYDAPELMGEISASSVSYDLHDKLRAYQRNGVQEYLVWRVRDRAIDWLVLNEGRFVPLAPGDDKIIRSVVFPGLWLDPDALLKDDMVRVLEVLNEGLKSTEHQAFVDKLSKTPPDQKSKKKS